MRPRVTLRDVFATSWAPGPGARTGILGVQSHCRRPLVVGPSHPPCWSVSVLLRFLGLHQPGSERASDPSGRCLLAAAGCSTLEPAANVPVQKHSLLLVELVVERNVAA
eukprot:3157105-Rhodomonas_salina.1